MKTRVLEQLRASISHLTTSSIKEEIFEYKVALKRPSSWPLKGENPIPITHIVEKMADMGINCPRNTENQASCLKTR